MNQSDAKPVLLDVSRLIWRLWNGRLPTGIDRVCLAYLDHYNSRARAAVHFRGWHQILGDRDSPKLFELLLKPTDSFRRRLVQTLALASLRPSKAIPDQIYLNVGHTGLNSPYLAPWVEQNGLRPVFLIHDLIPITHPHFCRPGEDDRHRQRMENALRMAQGFIANSAATERDLAAFAQAEGLPMPPSIVAWLGIDQIARAAPVSKPQINRPYFMLVGTIEARKNHIMILQAWEELVDQLGDEAPQLVIVGQRGWEAEAATKMLDELGPLKGHVLELGRCDDATMQHLLAGTRAMLMPSHVEGFGLPLVESLQQGVPVVASDLAVFREIAADIPTYLDPTDPHQWVSTILDYTKDSPDRQRQRIAVKQFQAPDWSSHFALVEKFLEQI